MRKSLGLASGALVIALICGCASSTPVTPPVSRTSQTPSEGEYRIGVPDLLEVRVWDQPDLSGPVLVRRDGKISVPLLGDVQAEGLTPERLARELEASLAQYVTAPRVDVAVTEMRSQVASVIGGGIERSGIVELRPNMRVIDAIAEMGGLSPFANKREIRVLRQTPEGEVSYPFDYARFMKGGAPESNFLLAPGDTIIVPE